MGTVGKIRNGIERYCISFADMIILKRKNTQKTRHNLYMRYRKKPCSVRDIPEVLSQHKHIGSLTLEVACTPARDSKSPQEGTHLSARRHSQTTVDPRHVWGSAIINNTRIYQGVYFFAFNFWFLARFGRLCLLIWLSKEK